MKLNRVMKSVLLDMVKSEYPMYHLFIVSDSWLLLLRSACLGMQPRNTSVGLDEFDRGPPSANRCWFLPLPCHGSEIDMLSSWLDIRFAGICSLMCTLFLLLGFCVDRKKDRGVASHEQKQDRALWGQLFRELFEVAHMFDRFTVDFSNNVARSKSRSFGWTV